MREGHRDRAEPGALYAHCTVGEGFSGCEPRTGGACQGRAAADSNKAPSTVFSGTLLTGKSARVECWIGKQGPQQA